MENKRIGDWIQTYTGIQFWPLDPKPEEVDIKDIAHALGNMCRFAGHCEGFYSVAEHSVHTALVAEPHLKIFALLHDAAEAYICDLPKPIKQLMPEYRSAEGKIELAIYSRFGIPFEWVLNYRKKIKEIDRSVLSAESKQIMKSPPCKWSTECEPEDIKIECWSPTIAELKFLKTFYDIYPMIK